MILNNYWRLKKALDSGVFYYSPGTRAVDIGLIDMSGNSFSNMANMNSTDYSLITALKSYLRVALGTGTTSPALTDYALETDVTSSLSSMTASVNVAFENGKEIVIITFSGNNNTQNDITINEIGIYRYNVWSNTGTRNVLFIREVLSEPIIIPSGEGFTRTFTWIEGDNKNS